VEGLTPSQVVAELDKYIIGQKQAKKAVAIALRNRIRRKMLDETIRDEVFPKNILMIGPTGVGKTEIARRLAKLDKAPFLKIEATKFTEVGYVGRDVESIVRDLVESAIRGVRLEKETEVEERAYQMAEERVINLLIRGPKKIEKPSNPFASLFGGQAPPAQDDHAAKEESSDEGDKKAQMLQLLRAGKLDNNTVDVDIEESSNPFMGAFLGANEEIGMNLQEMFGSMMPKKHRRKKVTVKDAMKILAHEEAEKLIDIDAVQSEALERVEQTGIVFLDEIDKIASRGEMHGPDVSREGVQRDILPLIEGSTVNTKYGPVKTDHVLFIAAGAFHVSKPSDLIPELQGRFPIRVNLESLGSKEFKMILTQPKNALIKQYSALLETEGVELEFTEDAIDAIADYADKVNKETENIGARRLHTILEKLLEDLSFSAPDMGMGRVVINEAYVREQLGDIIADNDLSRYIL
jgi:ATP-dependent HslUV protease ATP-binding subunit HslU